VTQKCDAVAIIPDFVYIVAKRMLDLALGVMVTFILALPLLVVAVIVKLTSKGPIIYWSTRIGRQNEPFDMPKFRTMRVDAPIVATHLMVDPDQYLTAVGGVLRKSSLDELPQLWSILKGDMSFVGPRPALFNQRDLIELRTAKGVHSLLPGLTGWAQINGRDELSVEDKVRFDAEYLRLRSLTFDIAILISTCIRVLKRDGISH
jgi:O-antigen biosynthesis protein WbqP